VQQVEGRVAFITGGGSGIGLGMAKSFVGAGMKVVIADLQQAHLDGAMQVLPADQVHPIQLDVTDRRRMSQVADETERVFGKVHILCNNAGVNLFNDICTANYEDWDWIMGVNCGGVVNGVQTFVPRIKAHGEGGHVVNTASMAAFIATGLAGIYCTSKFAVRGLSEALRWSLRPSGIGVSVLCPGLVDSAIWHSDRLRPDTYSGNTDAPDPQLVELLRRAHQSGMKPEEVGEKVLRAIIRNDFYVMSHPEFKDELRSVFDEALAALPEEPTPPGRAAFEELRRERNAQARARWPKI
jgi:NAD(P)-dependent dehydrogenase (short-subunit alcohol dehydrogenase family)